MVTFFFLAPEIIKLGLKQETLGSATPGESESFEHFVRSPTPPTQEDDDDLHNDARGHVARGNRARRVSDGNSGYGTEIDLWSLGVCLYALYAYISFPYKGAYFLY